jgi:hypothetical protein
LNSDESFKIFDENADSTLKDFFNA